MLLLFLLLILIQFPHASSIQCFGGNLTVIGGEISLEPLQQLTCNTNTFCMSYYANNGDTKILTMGCSDTYSLCNVSEFCTTLISKILENWNLYR